MLPPKDPTSPKAFESNHNETFSLQLKKKTRLGQQLRDSILVVVMDIHCAIKPRDRRAQRSFKFSNHQRNAIHEHHHVRTFFSNASHGILIGNNVSVVFLTDQNRPTGYLHADYFHQWHGLIATEPCGKFLVARTRPDSDGKKDCSKLIQNLVGLYSGQRQYQG